MPSTKPIIERQGNSRWLIRVERRLGDESAKGDVIIKHEKAPNSTTPPHVSLAGSRAWLALGEKELQAGNVEGAIQAAKKGLAELGSEYASPLANDDTGLKLAAAEERLRSGHAHDAASLMLRMLHTRTKLYADLHSEEIAK